MIAYCVTSVNQHLSFFSSPFLPLFFLCYGFADRLARMLGVTAMTVIMRLTSFLLLCIGVQIVWNGVSAFLGTLRIR